MAVEVHVADVGTAFRVTVKDEDGEIVDLSSASVMQLWFRKPDGTVAVQTAFLLNDGTDGIMEYVTVEGDLDLPGKWRVQGYVEVGPSKIHSDIHRFKLWANVQ